MKDKGQKQYKNYTIIYSGVEKQKRAKEGEAIVVHNKYQKNIEVCLYISSRILAVELLVAEDRQLTIILIYAPEDNKPKNEREDFFNQLQDVIESFPHKQPTVSLGDFNAHIGKEANPSIMQRFNENTLNNNGELMPNFCSLNELRINHTFFDYKSNTNTHSPTQEVRH